MFYGIVLVTVLMIELLAIYTVEKNVASPDFIFVAVFLVASINLLTNINRYEVIISFETVIIITAGSLFFILGTIVTKKVKINTNVRFNLKGKYFTAEEITVPSSVLILISLLNLFTTFYVAKQVVSLTRQFGFIGPALSAIGRYRELGLIYGARMQLGLIPTILTALSEANGYVFGCILANYLSNGTTHNKHNIILQSICFVTAFISTFSQGSRGGIYMILTSMFIFLLNRHSMGTLNFKLSSIFKALLIVAILLLAFQYSALLFNKSWDVSFYEYLSVYLGDPIINLNSYVHEKIGRAPLWGYFSFNPIYANLSGKLGIDLPSFSLGGYRYLNGHNLGNVYTIFAYIIADFGYIGSLLYLFIIAMIAQIFNNSLAGKENEVRVSKIIYGYMLTSITFSFFSNKVGENFSFYHIYVWIFEYLFIKLFTIRWAKKDL